MHAFSIRKTRLTNQSPLRRVVTVAEAACYGLTVMLTVEVSLAVRVSQKSFGLKHIRWS
jgi:hypothetical protein